MCNSLNSWVRSLGAACKRLYFLFLRKILQMGLWVKLYVTTHAWTSLRPMCRNNPSTFGYLFLSYSYVKLQKSPESLAEGKFFRWKYIYQNISFYSFKIRFGLYSLWNVKNPQNRSKYINKEYMHTGHTHTHTILMTLPHTAKHLFLSLDDWIYALAVQLSTFS